MATGFDSAGINEHLHYIEHPRRARRDATPFNKEEAQRRRASMIVPLISGDALDFRLITPQQVHDNTEMMQPLVRPFGCGPVAPTDWLVLRTYQRIVEVRDEIRMDELGLCVGDRTFKRRYQQAQRDLMRYEAASLAVRASADAAGARGVEVASSGGGTPTIIRSPEQAVRWAFRYLGNKHWHRYLLPFGCYFLDRTNAVDATAFKAWIDCTVPCKDNVHLRINPYSVTAADVLYLCNTTGYLDRFMYIIGIILWCKRRNCNLLIHTHLRGYPRTTHEARVFVSLEKHLHLFGSIYLHRRVLETNKIDVGGDWTEKMEMLNRLENECCAEFGVDRLALRRDFENMTVEKVKSNLGMLRSVFPKCARISDSRASAPTGH